MNIDANTVALAAIIIGGLDQRRLVTSLHRKVDSLDRSKADKTALAALRVIPRHQGAGMVAWLVPWRAWTLPAHRSVRRPASGPPLAAPWVARLVSPLACSS